MPETETTVGPMYDWVAHHTTERDEVIEFCGSILDLLRVAREQDRRSVALETKQAALLTALRGYKKQHDIVASTKWRMTGECNCELCKAARAAIEEASR